MTARLRLEGHSLETAGRALVARIAIVVVAVAIALVGVVFVAIGLADAAGALLNSKPAGLVIVGGICLVLGIVAIFLAGRPRRRGRAKP